MSKPTSDIPNTDDVIHAQPPTRVGMAYDVFMLIMIVINLILLGIDALMMGQVGGSVAHVITEDGNLSIYRQHWHPLVALIDDWFTVILVVELAVRWLWAVMRSHYHRWFFFPFIHWYEVLGCLPAFRALRLLRAVVLAYRLHQMGYTILPRSWVRLGRFYYDVILEEISDRIIINVLDGIERELRQSTTHGALIRQIIDKHRPQLIAATGELLQLGLAPALAARTEDLQHAVGDAVYRALADVPELHQLMRLMPIVGTRLEQQVQAIGRRIGDNLTAELIRPFSAPATAHDPINPAIQSIAEHIGDLPLEASAIEALLESLVFESLDAVRKQVAVQQWKTQR